MHDIGLRWIPVANVCHVVQVDRRAVDDLDRKVTQTLDFGWRAVELQGVFEPPDLLCAGRQDEILCRQGGRDVLSRKTSRLQSGRIQVYLHLSRLTAIGQWHCG